MVAIDNLSNDAFQTTSVVLSDGTKVILNLSYLPAIQRWTVDIIYGESFIVHGINLTIHPNILRNWRNLLPFGLACTTIDGADPFNVEDFSSHRATLYMLASEDVVQIEESIFGVLE